jgi:hypothetical protein
MVDEELIREQFPDSVDLEDIQAALRTLQRLGVFKLFIHANKMRVVDSFEHASDEDLAHRLRDMRLENKTLIALNLLFTTPPQKELDNAYES